MLSRVRIEGRARPPRVVNPYIRAPAPTCTYDGRTSRPIPTSPPVSVRTDRGVTVPARGSDGRAGRTRRPANPCTCRARSMTRILCGGLRKSGQSSTGVAPVPWTPILLARRRSPRCRSRDRRTRRHSDSRWSSWFGPDVHRESWLGSSSRRPRRYETGSRRLIATLASAPTACAPKNMKRFVGCAGRTGSCAKNAKFWQKPRPGSRGRPDPGGLPVHEHEPSSFSRRHDGPRAR